MKFVDSTGLSILWNKIKSSFLSLEGGVIGNKDNTNQRIEATEISEGSITLYSSFNDTEDSNDYYRKTSVRLRVDQYDNILIIELGDIAVNLEQGDPDNHGRYTIECNTAITTEELNEVLV